MFNLFKKQVTAEAYGHQLWLLCCDWSEKFCLNYRPKLRLAGYLQNPTEDRVFMDEAMRLHLWIISYALGVENRNVLDALHNHAHGLNIVNSKTLREIYAIYNTAASKEMELQDAGLTQPALGMTAIQYLVNNKAHTEDITAMLVRIEIEDVINAVRKMRMEVKIRN